MTLLTIVQAVADEIGLPRPVAVSGATDQLARQMLALANLALEEVSRLDWPVLVLDYSFSTIVTQSDYPLPADFERLIGDSAYLASQYYNLRGSMTPADWMRQKNALPSQIGRYKMRVYGNPLKFNLQPAPGTVETVAFEYVTNKLAFDGTGVAKTIYTEDTDMSRVPEKVVKANLKWRIKHAKGLDYNEDHNDYVFVRDTAFAQQLSLGSLPVAMRHMIDNPEVPEGYVPEFGFGA